MQENIQELKKKLISGCQDLQVKEPDKIELLWEYLLRLQKWNQVYNLTAVRNLDDMISQHILDSIAIYPYLQGKDFIDVGTGAGLPGIPLSIMASDKNFTLLDSNSKKTAFLLNVKASLKLNNVNVIHSRAEDHKQTYDGILSRAFSTLQDCIQLTQHLAKPETIWYAMKGPNYEDEVKALPNMQVVVKSLNIPFLTKQRFLIMIKNTEAL